METYYSSPEGQPREILQEQIQNYEKCCSQPSVPSSSAQEIIVYNNNSNTGVVKVAQNKPFECPECNETYVKRQDLKLHFLGLHMGHHTDHENLNCPFCEFSCVGTKYLMDHIKTHPDDKKEKRDALGEKLFTCTECDLVFTKRSEREKHLTTHAGFKPYVCIECGFKCARKTYLKNHLQKCHVEKEIFECAKCGYKCTTKSEYKFHMVNHTNHNALTCPLGDCKYICVFRDVLEKHMQTHRKGDLTLSCLECEHICKTKSELKKHVTLHRPRPTKP